MLWAGTRGPLSALRRGRGRCAVPARLARHRKEWVAPAARLRRIPGPAAHGGSAAACVRRSPPPAAGLRRIRSRCHDRGAVREVPGPRGAVPAALAPAPAAGRQLEPERGGLPGRQRLRLPALVLPPHRPAAPLPLQQVRPRLRGIPRPLPARRSEAAELGG